MNYYFYVFYFIKNYDVGAALQTCNCISLEVEKVTIAICTF